MGMLCLFVACYTSVSLSWCGLKHSGEVSVPWQMWRTSELLQNMLKKCLNGTVRYSSQPREMLKGIECCIDAKFLYWTLLQVLISTIQSQLSWWVGITGVTILNFTPLILRRTCLDSRNALRLIIYFNSSSRAGIPLLLNPMLLQIQWLALVVYPKRGVLVLDRHLED